MLGGGPGSESLSSFSSLNAGRAVAIELPIAFGQPVDNSKTVKSVSEGRKLGQKRKGGRGPTRWLK